jgi:Flp pilus assembly protein TadD
MDSLARAKELFLAALAHQERGELAAAEQIYREALELAPTRPSIANNLALVLLRLERFSEAVIPVQGAAVNESGRCDGRSQSREIASRTEGNGGGARVL